MARFQVLLAVNLLTAQLPSAILQDLLFSPANYSQKSIEHKESEGQTDDKNKSHDSRKHEHKEEGERREEKEQEISEDEEEEEEDDDEEEEEEEEENGCNGLLTKLLSAVTNLVAQIGPIQILSKGDINSEQKIQQKKKRKKQSSDSEYTKNDGNNTSSKKGFKKDKGNYGLISGLLNLVSNLLAQIGPLQLLSQGDIYHQQSIEMDEDE